MKKDFYSVKFLLVTALIILAPFCMKSQLLQMKKATKQHWAGGVCCVSGINYVIHLRVTKPRTEIKIDSLWIDGRLYDNLDETEGFMQVMPDSAGASIYFRLGCSSGRHGWDDFPVEQDVHDFQQRRVVQDTDAVMFYRHRGVAHRFSVGKMEELFPLAYP